MDTLSLALTAALVASWLGLLLGFFSLRRRFRRDLGRTARHCRALIRELEAADELLTRAREDNLQLRGGIAGATTLKQAPSVAARRNLPSQEAVQTTDNAGFAPTQSSDPQNRHGFAPTQPMFIPRER